MPGKVNEVTVSKEARERTAMRKATEERRFLERVVAHTRASVLEVFRPDSCIATTRILVDVLDYFSISVRPVAVMFRAYNALSTKMMIDEVPVEDWPEEAWSVGIIPGQKPTSSNNWPGHLVALHRAYLLDGSLDQASRPDKGLLLGPGVFKLPDEWDRQEKLLWRREDNVTLIYEPMRDVIWRRSPDWRRGAFKREIVARTIEAIKAEEG